MLLIGSHFGSLLEMEGVGENFGAPRTEQVSPQTFCWCDHAVPNSGMDCVVMDYAKIFQRPSQHFHDGESSNLPDAHLDADDRNEVDQLITVDEFELELQRQLAEEPQPPSTPNITESNVVEFENFPINRPVLPPSEAIGVTYHKKNKQWEAHLWVKNRQLGKRKKKGKQIFLGNFKTEHEAKTAHDRAAIKLDVRQTSKGKPYPLNFPESTHVGYILEHAEWSARDFVWKIRRFSHKFSKGKSRMKGVSVRSRKGTTKYFETKISQTVSDGEKRTFDLGKFECEEEAGKEYDRALLFLKGADSDCVTNFRPSGYSIAEIQEVGTRILGTVA